MHSQPDLTSWEKLFDELARVSDQRHQTFGIPPACYADEVVFREEMKALFHQGWISVGRSDRWPEEGDYTAMDIGGIPLVILRSKDGKLKAFANSCRHRGSQMLSGEGNCKKIRCPFHWWTYDLDGQLKVYPRMEKAIDFKPQDFGLVEFRLSCKEGFAFVCFDEETVALDLYLGDFSEIHMPWAFEQMVTTRVREFEVDCNWKTYIEVFNEYYHLPSVHPDSINWLYPEPDASDQVEGDFTTQFGETIGNAALLPDAQDQSFPIAQQLQGREKNGTRYSWVYPNMTFAASPDSMWMYETYPISAARTRVIQTICFPQATVESGHFESRVENYYCRIDAAIAEDIPFLEMQQHGLNSKFAEAGRFSTLEPSVANFAFWYARTMLVSLPNGIDRP